MDKKRIQKPYQKRICEAERKREAQTKKRFVSKVIIKVHNERTIYEEFQSRGKEYQTKWRIKASM